MWPLPAVSDVGAADAVTSVIEEELLLLTADIADTAVGAVL